MANTPKTPTGQLEQKKELSPDSIPKVIWLLAKSIVSSIPRQFVWILLKSAGFFLLIMWINFYVIGVRNAGYGGGPVVDYQQKPWVWLFNVGGNKPAFSMLAFMIPLLLTSLWAQIKSLGFKKFFSNLFHLFNWTGYCASNAGKQSLPTLLFAMAAMMPFGFFFQNTGLYITFAVSQFFGYIAQNRNLVFVFSRAGWMDFQRIFRGRKPLADLNPGIGGFLSLGLLLGAVFLCLIPLGLLKVISILLFLLFIGLGIFTKIGKVPPKAIAGILLFVGVNLLWYRLSGRVYADDAGYDELGNNFGNYIKDPGGQMVIKSGVQPGVLGVLGSWFGSAIGTVADGALYVGGKAVDGAKYVGGKVVDGVKYVGGKAVDGVKFVGNTVVDGVTYVGQTVVDGVTYVGNTAVEIYNDPNKFADYTKDVITGTWENIKSDVNQAGETIGNAWEATKDLTGKAADAIVDAGSSAIDSIVDGVTDVWNNPGVYIDTLINGTVDTIKDTASLGYEVLTNPQIIVDTIAGTGADLVNIGDKVLTVGGNIIGAVVDGVWTTITDPKKAWEFIKDAVGYENFKNVIDPNLGLLDRLGQLGIGMFKFGTTVTGVQAIYGAGAKIAATGVTQTIKNFGDDVLGVFIKGQGTGIAPSVPKFTAAGIADTSHLNPTQLKNFQQLVKEFGFDEATIRMGGNKAIAQKIASGEVLAKPHAIMNKTMNAFDELLGGPKNSQGLAAHFQPTLPSTADMQKMNPADLEKLWNRYLQRFTEFKKEKDKIEAMVGKTIKVTPEGLITDMTGKPYGSDWDLGHLIKNGAQASSAETKAFVDACKKLGIPVEHGSVGDWPNMSDFQKEAYGNMLRKMMNVKGGEGVISVGPQGPALKKFLDAFIKAAPAT